MILPTRKPGLTDVAKLTAEDPDNIIWSTMNEATGGKPLFNGFLDLNVNARRWTNTREIWSQQKVYIPPFKGTFTDTLGDDVEVIIPSRESLVFDEVPAGYENDYYSDHLPV